jgi:hypothetical protein
MRRNVWRACRHRDFADCSIACIAGGGRNRIFPPILLPIERRRSDVDPKDEAEQQPLLSQTMNRSPMLTPKPSGGEKREVTQLRSPTLS